MRPLPFCDGEEGQGDRGFSSPWNQIVPKTRPEVVIISLSSEDLDGGCDAGGPRLFLSPLPLLLPLPISSSCSLLGNKPRSHPHSLRLPTPQNPTTSLGFSGAGGFHLVWGTERLGAWAERVRGSREGLAGMRASTMNFWGNSRETQAWQPGAGK